MKEMILVTGSDGLVGSRFVELSNNKERLHLPSEKDMDITDLSAVRNVIDSYNFSAVIHFAAFTNVGEAEKQRGNKEESSWKVNVEGTRNLVKAIEPYKEKIHFIQISTDMVFPGSAEDPGPYDEGHKPENDFNKVTWYGYTKGEAERVVMSNLEKSSSIVRIIYPVRASFSGKLDYLRNPLKLFDEGKLYPLFSDQQVSICFTDELALVLDKIINNSIRGVFHVASNDTGSPYNIISYLIESVRGKNIELEKTTIEKYLARTNSSPTRYPKYGGLKSDKTQRLLGIKFRTWREIINELIKQGISTRL